MTTIGPSDNYISSAKYLIISLFIQFQTPAPEAGGEKSAPRTTTEHLVVSEKCVTFFIWMMNMRRDIRIDCGGARSMEKITQYVQACQDT